MITPYASHAGIILLITHWDILIYYTKSANILNNCKNNYINTFVQRLDKDGHHMAHTDNDDNTITLNQLTDKWIECGCEECTCGLDSYNLQPIVSDD